VDCFLFVHLLQEQRSAFAVLVDVFSMHPYTLDNSRHVLMLCRQLVETRLGRHTPHTLSTVALVEPVLCALIGVYTRCAQLSTMNAPLIEVLQTYTTTGVFAQLWFHVLDLVTVAATTSGQDKHTHHARAQLWSAMNVFAAVAERHTRRISAHILHIAK
jgi:hypothetical protein